LLGLIGMIPIALGLARGTLSLDAAGVRALVLLATLLVIERLVLPVCISLVRPHRRDHDHQV
jgi:hypothetical protein